MIFTRKCGELHSQCAVQPLVGLWPEGGRVCRVGLQLGQLRLAGAAGENPSFLRAGIIHSFIAQLIVTAVSSQNRTPLQQCTMGSQANHAQSFCTNDFYRKKKEVKTIECTLLSYVSFISLTLAFLHNFA